MVDIPTVFYKDPDAVLDYWVDWSTWLGTDTIATATWLVPSTLTKTGQSETTTRATAWISGGTAGEEYSVTCRITTAAGRTDDRKFTLRIEQR